MLKYLGNINEEKWIMAILSQKELMLREYINKENAFRHLRYDEEMYPYELMRQGDMRSVEESQRVFWQSGTTAHLVDDPVQNQKYLCVSSITIATRIAIENGMPEEDALNASDLYIRKMDACKSVEEVLNIHKDIMAFYTGKMAQIRKSTAYSKHVTSTMQYIRDHLNEELNLSGIASYVCLNASYLSALFHEETGMTVMDYIQECRVEWAENLLRFSDYSILEISNITSFSSQSYFGAVFRKRTGLTPGEYRKKYYRKGVLQRRKVTKERKGDLLALE